MSRLAVAVALGAIASVAFGATYYVDFEKGNDAADGLSPRTACMHAPGDPAAEGNAKGIQLKPGDTVRFKGGVVYRGTVVCSASGEEGKPIVYDGNSDGTYGAGRAVIDGSEVVREWKRCASQEEAGGNPNWKRLWRANLPKGLLPGTANLCEGETLLWIAQEPNQPDPFFSDSISNFRKVPNAQVTTTSLTDPSFFTQADEHAWDSAYVAVWVVPNVTQKRRILRYVPSEHRIEYDRTNEPYRDRDELYAVENSLAILDRPGEYVLRTLPDGSCEVFVWPFDDASPSQGRITYSARNFGFNVVNGASHLVITNFLIQKISGTGTGSGIAIKLLDWNRDTADVVIRNNHIRHIRHTDRGYGGIYVYRGNNVLIEGNLIEECPLSMGILCGGTGIRVRSNIVRKAGAQSIWFMGCADSEIVGNEVYDGRGTHANGISVYQKCRNILVWGNKVLRSNIAFTTESSDNVTVAYNIFHTADFYAFANWAENRDLKVYHNVILRDADLTPYTQVPQTTATLKNNILTGKPFGLDANHNLRVAVADLEKVFVDPAHHDYRLKEGSPAIDAGVDVGYDRDFAGTKVPQGKAPDVGAFEFVP